MTDIQTQPCPDYITHAADVLEALLSTDLDIETRLAVGAALVTLIDVYPPYSPPADLMPTNAAVDVRAARQALRDAACTAAGVEECVRIGLAAQALHGLQDPP